MIRLHTRSTNARVASVALAALLGVGSSAAFTACGSTSTSKAPATNQLGNQGNGGTGGGTNQPGAPPGGTNTAGQNGGGATNPVSGGAGGGSPANGAGAGSP